MAPTRRKRRAAAARVGVSPAPASIARAGAPAEAHSTAPASLSGALVVALVLSLALLLAHAGLYRFLTDDSYISFRYARNLANGHGLVFNPGYERVEGYTNFLWVLILAPLARLGIPPERAANPLSLTATIALWGVIAAFALRRYREPGRRWLAALPLFGLAITRSVAVWSTSGLETRLFELLMVAGLLRLTIEVEALDLGRERRAMACILFALATWTRPDALLISACAFGCAGAYVLARRPASFVRLVTRQTPFVLMVTAHYVFRRLYYGDWLPNTYYAKFGGHFWWKAGGSYLLAFALEYFIVLWLPLIVAGIARNVANRTAFFPLLVGGVVIPHMIYIAAIGGDHFEYRPLDLYFPLAFLVMTDGVAHFIASPRRWVKPATAAYLALIAGGLVLIPWESHRQFINRYKPGFPGGEVNDLVEAQSFLSPGRDVILRLPGLEWIARTHRDLTRWMTLHFVGIRAEEHRMFLATAIPEGLTLGRLKQQGVLPPDTYIAVDCVGAIPYYSDLRTLDRLGLTDAHVAHSKPVREIMAHSKSATLDYARSRGVDLWAVDAVHLILPLTSTRLLVAVSDGYMTKQPNYAVEAGDAGYLICELPMGLDSTSRRLPSLRIFSLGDSSFIRNYLARIRAAYEDSLLADPGNYEAAHDLAKALILNQDFGAARRVFAMMSQRFPTLVEGYEFLASCDVMLDRIDEARSAARQGLAVARANADTAAYRRVSEILSELEQP
jgi:arabinofuranosyltransferase